MKASPPAHQLWRTVFHGRDKTGAAVSPPAPAWGSVRIISKRSAIKPRSARVPRRRPRRMKSRSCNQRRSWNGSPWPRRSGCRTAAETPSPQGPGTNNLIAAGAGPGKNGCSQNFRKRTWSTRVRDELLLRDGSRAGPRTSARRSASRDVRCRGQVTASRRKHAPRTSRRGAECRTLKISTSRPGDFQMKAVGPGPSPRGGRSPSHTHRGGRQSEARPASPETGVTSEEHGQRRFAANSQAGSRSPDRESRPWLRLT